MRHRNAAEITRPKSQFTLIPMRDGVGLAADCLLPPGKGPFPVVLTRTVYGRDKSMAQIASAFGAAYVIQDTRGRGSSEGEDHIFTTDGWGELQDGVDTVRWILEQPWCNGKAATYGASALGITQMLMAPAEPRLAAQAILVAPSKFYGQLAYQGGVWRKSLCEGWLNAVECSEMIGLWKSHPTDDAFWAGYDAEAQAGRITAPGIHVGGWWDIFQQGTINNFKTRQEQGGEGARGHQQLIMGPWTHSPAPEAGDLKLPENSMFDFNGQAGAFLQAWLTGQPETIMELPAVRYYTLGDVDDPQAPGNEWRTADAWPPFSTVETPYYLSADGRLSADASMEKTSSLSYAFDPANPCPTLGGANLLIEAGPKDQHAIGERADVLKFATEPLDTPIEATGRVRVRLYVSSDAPDTDFTAKLVDIYPDGREFLMLDSIQRVKFRNGLSPPPRLKPVWNALSPGTRRISPGRLSWKNSVPAVTMTCLRPFGPPTGKRHAMDLK